MNCTKLPVVVDKNLRFKQVSAGTLNRLSLGLVYDLFVKQKNQIVKNFGKQKNK